MILAARPFDFLNRRLASLRSGEAASAALFFAYAFVLLVCYYQLRLLRESLLLTDGSAELKSYAQAAIAATLMLLVPVYAFAFKRVAPAQLVRGITGLFVASLLAFCALGQAGIDIGFAYYVWVGVFGVTMMAQFWAHAAHSFDLASGQRVFPIVMAGATLGGLAGAAVANTLFALLGAWNLLLLAAGLLAATVPLVEITRRAVPPKSRNRRHDGCEHVGPRACNGFALVLRDRYLLAIAALVVLLNCVNTTGEYLLTELVLRHTDAQLAVQPELQKSALIATFYGNYYFTVNALTVLLQLLLVGRVFRRIGVSGAILVLPLVALLGYGLLAFVPIFAVVQLVKIAENGVNYSVMNTARHALFLPLPAGHQYQGKTAIDGFFWRVGDLTQAALVYLGLNWLGFGLEQFAILNVGLAVAWLAVAVAVARRFRGLAAREPTVVRPRRTRRLALVGLGLATAAAAPAAAAETVATGTVAPAAFAAPLLTRDAPPLFASEMPLELELDIDLDTLCRNPERKGCEDAPGLLRYRAADGSLVPIEVTLRARGRWRVDTGNCPLPALFVFFDARTSVGTPFANQPMLPLTTHCRERASYEQYVLKEYLAYRVYNLLSSKSLRVRLASITYRDTDRPERATTHFGFFTEHFDALAERQAAKVWRVEAVDLTNVVPDELATLATFQYMIGNIDWSAVFGHNTVALRNAAGIVSVVPYDFDFSGLVDAEYAGPPPGFRIRSVRQRVFRGFCTPRPDWDTVFAAFTALRGAVADLVTSVPALQATVREHAAGYLDEFFVMLDSAAEREVIVAACRDH